MVYFKAKMQSRFFPQLLLIFFCFITIGCRNIERPDQTLPQAARGILDLSSWDFQNNGQIPLEGEWRFLWKELRSPQEIADSEDSYFVYVPDKWHHYTINGGNPGYQGYGTFSLTLILPDEEQYYGVSFDGAGSAYSLWMNGEMLMQKGTVGTSKEQMVPEKSPQSFIFKSSGEPLELVLHISNYHHKKGGFRNSLYIGSPEQILRFQGNSWIQEAFTLGILLIMGLYHLHVYIFRRKFKSSLYFALLCFSFLMRLGVTNQDLFLLAFPFISWTAAFYLDYLSLFFIPPLVALFYRSLFPLDIPRRFIQFLFIVSISFSLFVILAGTYIASFTTRYYQILLLLEITYYLYFLIRINLKKREGALIITIASAVLFITSTIEILSLWDWLIFDKIGVYGFLSFILVQSILLSQRYSQAFVRVESLSEELKSTNQNLQESETRYRNIFENSNDVLFLTEVDSRIIDVSPSCEKMLGLTREDILNQPPPELLKRFINSSLYENISKTGEPLRNIETVLKHRDGHEIDALITLSLRFDEKKQAAGLQGSIHDITDRKRAERERMRALELEQIALTDPLTKAYNRRFFSEFARKEWERAQRKGSSFSLVMLDIDFFKRVNDKYGHLKGDEVLINLTRLCHKHIRSTDILARFGGEEFVILFPDAEGHEAAKLAEILREKVSRTILSRKDDEEIPITISLGISCWNPGEKNDLTELLNQADMALYQAKESGRNRVVLFKNENRLSES